MYRIANIAGIFLGLLCAWGASNPLRGQSAGAIRQVTLANTLAANDDSSTDAVPLNIDTAAGINFFGQNFKRVYVNNNGNLTFSGSFGDYTPNGLAQGVGLPIIAPFFADVDTSGTGSGLVQYGNATINGFNTFVANYINVGYYSGETDKLNSFQVVLYDRSDTGAGNFDIEFNYNQILWETGDASGGTDGLGGTSAAVGYSNGLSGTNNIFFQLAGSLVNGALIDGGPDALISHSLNSGVPGRYVFPVRNGVAALLLSNVACLPGILGQGAVSSCTVTLTGNAPAGAATTVTLSSSSSALTVPASVTVAAGSSTATFNATGAAGIASNQSATVTATFGGDSQTATVNLTSAVQAGYIGVSYYSTPPSPCPAALSVLCAANNTVNNANGGEQDGPVFVFVNTSNTPITNGVLTIVGVDFFDVGTIAANSSVTVIPGISNDGQNHGSDNFFTVTGSVNDSSDEFPSLNSTQFQFTGQQGGTQIQSIDVCGVIAAPIFTPACTAGTSNDGTVTGLNFLGGPGDNDGPCDNCFGPAIVALLGTFTSGSVSGPPLAVSSASLPGASTGVAYLQQLAATGGTPPYTWTLAGGSLPAGMGLASTGTISGTSAKAGSYTFTARATDSTGTSAVGSFSVSVTPPAVTIATPSPLPAGMVTVNYPLQVLSAAGGYAPYTFTAPANSLPAGLALASSGSISGTPTVAGTFTFTLTATDEIGQTGTKSIAITVRPFAADLTISAGSLAFSLAARATALPESQTVQVESTDVTKTLPWSTAVTPSQTWLSVAAGGKSGGTTPGLFTVSLTSAASSLAASTTPYQATIVITCVAPSPCAGSAQNVTVSLLVSTVSPELTVLTDLLSFTTFSTSPQSTTQSLGVQNTGGGTISITSATCAQTWCTVGTHPASLGAGVAGSITVTANPANLSAGFYFTELTIVSSAGTTAIPVTLFIASSSSLTLEPSGVQLIMPAGGVAAVPDTSFLVGVSGTAPVAWTAAVLPGAPWLNLSATSGTSTGAAPGAVGYSINQSAAAALTPQAYYGTIRVTSTSVVNSPQDFQVVLDVTTAAAPQAPSPTPAGLIFTTAVNGTAPAQIDRVFASSAAAVTYQASTSTTDGNNWLSVSPATGITSAASPAQSSISVNPAGLAAGVYFGSVSYSLAAAAVPTVNVTLIVEAAGGSLRTSQTESPHATCSPSKIIPTQTALVNNFASPASWPTPLEIQLTNDCGSPVANGQVVATFSNGDPPLALSLQNSSSGLYSGTWTPRNTGAQVTVTATATTPGFTAATTQISGAVVPNAAPTLNPNGTLNVFTAQQGLPVAPGTIVQIYGSDLATQTMAASAIPLATSLAGTSVIIGGVQVPLYFVSAGQVNAQFPFELPAGQPYQVIVNNNGALSTPLTIQSVAITPEIAAYPSGYAIAQHAADNSLITDASPAKPSEYVVIYLAGMGPTTVPVSSGTASPGSPLANTSAAPTITLNSEPVAGIPFSGLTPTLAGLYQIDLQVPADAPNGDLTLVVSQPGFQATSVILPVHN